MFLENFKSNFPSLSPPERSRTQENSQLSASCDNLKIHEMRQFTEPTDQKTNFDFHYRNIATVCLMLTEKIRFFKIYFQGMIRIYIFECWPQQRTYTRRVFGCFSKRKIARGFGKKSVTYRYRVTL